MNHDFPEYDADGSWIECYRSLPHNHTAVIERWEKFALYCCCSTRFDCCVVLGTGVCACGDSGWVTWMSKLAPGTAYRRSCNLKVYFLMGGIWDIHTSTTLLKTLMFMTRVGRLWWPASCASHEWYDYEQDYWWLESVPHDTHMMWMIEKWCSIEFRSQMEHVSGHMACRQYPFDSPS